MALVMEKNTEINELILSKTTSFTVQQLMDELNAISLNVDKNLVLEILNNFIDSGIIVQNGTAFSSSFLSRSF
ncbi:hypothetical protein QUF84_04900 [Fictibacillus enclensis]|uniref:hypothetical protein n=1 Tax=Fictibacillus enclensis TaxID=1017270 RepID=UPI0025A183D9|nr:hypothetical protein [Fictibacillus enclensis]MDM5336568.1 hypothetical protein [Fictibacillus enclensis]